MTNNTESWGYHHKIQNTLVTSQKFPYDLFINTSLFPSSCQLLICSLLTFFLFVCLMQQYETAIVGLSLMFMVWSHLFMPQNCCLINVSFLINEGRRNHHSGKGLDRNNTLSWILLCDSVFQSSKFLQKDNGTLSVGGEGDRPMCGALLPHISYSYVIYTALIVCIYSSFWNLFSKPLYDMHYARFQQYNDKLDKIPFLKELIVHPSIHPSVKTGQINMLLIVTLLIVQRYFCSLNKYCMLIMYWTLCRCWV